MYALITENLQNNVKNFENNNYTIQLCKALRNFPRELKTVFTVIMGYCVLMGEKQIYLIHFECVMMYAESREASSGSECFNK